MSKICIFGFVQNAVKRFGVVILVVVETQEIKMLNLLRKENVKRRKVQVVKKDNCKDCVCKCEHIVGFLYPYEECDIVTLDKIKKDIKTETALGHNITFEDFVDNGDKVCFERFEFCPRCGAKIDWEELKLKAMIDNDKL